MYSDVKGIYPKNAGQMTLYTWADESLKSLSNQILATNRDIDQSATLSFQLVYIDRSGSHQMRPLGSVSVGAGPDDDKCLRDLGFQTGDYLDIAVLSRPVQAQPRIRYN